MALCYTDNGLTLGRIAGVAKSLPQVFGFICCYDRLLTKNSFVSEFDLHRDLMLTLYMEK